MNKPIAAACALAASLTIAVAPAPAHAQDRFIGEILMTGYTFCPRNTLEANGQLLQIRTNTALFSLYGTQYGGDGRTTFGLPDLRGSTDANGRELRFCVVTQGIFPSRS